MVDLDAKTHQTGVLSPIVPPRQIDIELLLSISSDVASQRTLQDLLDKAVSRTRDDYGLYHVQIYLLDEYDQKRLVLASGSGDTGKQLVGMGHSISLTHVNSVVARAARERVAVVVNDVFDSPSFLPNPYLPLIRSEMAIPMMAGGYLVGILDLQADVTERFTDQDRRVQTMLAEQVAVAVQNARITDRATRQARNLNTVAEVAREINRQRESAELLWTVADLTRERFDLYHVHIYLYDKDRERLVLSAASGFVGRTQVQSGQSIPMSREQSLVARCARERRPITIDDVSTEPNHLPNPFLPDTLSEMVVPMEDGDTLIGVLDVQSTRRRAFDLNDVETQTILAGQVAQAVLNARAFESVRQAEREARLLADVTENTPIGIYVYQLEDANDPTSLRIRVANAATATVAGVSPEDVIGKRIIEAFPNLEGSPVPGIYANVALTGQAAFLGDAAYKRRDGSTTIFNVTAFPLPNQSVGISLEDVTSRREAEAQNKLLADVTENSPIGIYVFQLENPDDPTSLRVRVANATALGISSLRAEEVMEKPILEAFPELIGTPVPGIYAQVITTGQAVQLGESTYTLRTGETVVFNIQAFPLPNQSVGISFEDVTSRREAEAQNKLLADVTENSPIGIYVYQLEDADDPLSLRVTVANAASARATGIDPATVLGKRIKDAFPALAETAIPHLYSQVALTGNPFHVGEVPYTHGDGEAHIYDVMAFPLPNQSVGISFENITERKHAEERLQLLTAAVEATTSGISVADARQSDNPVIYVNPAYSAITGYDSEEIIGRNTRFLQGEDKDQPGLHEIRTGIKEQRPVRAIVRNYRKGGEMFYSQIAISPLRNEEGEVTHFVGINTDVTERVQAEERERRRANELATVADISAQVSASRQVSELLFAAANRMAEGFDLYHCNIYVYDPDRHALKLAAASGPIGEMLVKSAHFIPFNAVSLVARAARTREVVTENNTLGSMDFLPNPMLPKTRAEMAVPMIVAGQLMGVLDVQSNIINRFDAEAAQVQTTLAAQIGIALENARAYGAMQEQADRDRETAERLREVDRLKSQFLANMSHELRTPLNSIIGYSEILIDGMDGDLTEDAQEDVQAIHESGQHLLSLINEILDLAKIEAGQMRLDFEPIAPLEISNEVLKIGNALKKDKPLTLAVEVVGGGDLPPVSADPFRMKQVILNLVSNGVKFTEQGSVTIRLEKVENGVKFMVVDTGVGISNEHLDLIFERFSQLDGSSTRRAGGTGLGLTITRQLVQMHGSDISVESEVGKGSVFSFVLPVAQK
ncbi:MAG: GAF domain-containing protein [Anaerolineae bacterium]|nr:GAF domain-containing protein [Anaerolineae bacterium]